MKTAVIVGATSGIGKALAELLARQGYRVGLTGRRSELLEELQKKSPQAFVAKPFDVTDTAAVPQKLTELVDELGGLDLLVVSSGTGHINLDLDFRLDEQTILTNVLGFTAVADWAFRHFEAQRHGHLVVISSLGGLRGNRMGTSYSATKAYQMNYAEGLRQKATHLKAPIFVTDIRPGFVDTAMAQGEGLFWVMPVEKTAQQIYTAIRKKCKRAYITKRWNLIALLLKLLPSALYDRL